MLRIGVDIGGTFTDFAIWRSEAGGYTKVEAMKVPSTPPNFAVGMQQGLLALIEAGRIDPDEPMLIVHGTTVSTNAVIERSGAPLALLVTAGFRDILAVARLRVDRPVNLFANRAPPLIPRRMVHEIDERLLADGTVDRSLPEAAVQAAAHAAHHAGAAAIAICFLHAHRNPVHELQAAAAIRRTLPDMDLVLSHEVWPQAGEYERASAALLNAYARRAMAGYLGALDRFLAERLPRSRLLVTKSNGGVMAAAEATRMPIHTLLSGPAAGVAAACALGGMIGAPLLLTMDMGGTSTDISIVRDGRAMSSQDGRVGDFPLMMPVTAIEAIGAGGGSIAWMDGPVLKMGPRSAGARPGPACYGNGGTQPTLSDAYLLAGYLSEDAPLAGGLRLRRDLAEAAMRPLAEALGRDLTSTAEACVVVASANMLANALPFVARLGMEPAALTLMIFGGAGAIHGPLLADEMGIGRVIVPRVSSVFCAFGCLVSDLLYDTVRGVHGIADARIGEIFAELRRDGSTWLAEQSTEISPAFEYHADIRYVGQSFDVDVLLDPGAAEAGDLEAIAGAFHAEHARLFGHSRPGAEIEVIALRLRVRGPLPRPEGGISPARPGVTAAPPRRRQVRFDGAWHDTSVHDWNTLPPGWRAPGPLIVEQETATVVVPPGFDATLGALGDLILERR